MASGVFPKILSISSDLFNTPKEIFSRYFLPRNVSLTITPFPRIFLSALEHNKNLLTSSHSFAGLDRDDRQLAAPGRDPSPEAVRPGRLHRHAPHEGPLHGPMPPPERRDPR